MTRRPAGLLLSLALAAGVLAAPPSAQAAACGAAPVLESATRNGSTDLAGFKVAVDCFAVDGSQDVGWRITTADDAPDLGSAALADTWAVRINTGSVVPRVAFTHGKGVGVTRTRTSDGDWHVTITAKPVLLLGECDQGSWPWVCPSVATQQWNGLLDGTVTDYGSWEDAAQRNSFFGMDYSTNIAATSVPPQIVNDPGSDAQMILLELANPHYLKTPSTTVFKGFAKVRIPNAFLKAVYDIDAPTTLTSAGLAPSLGGSGGGGVTVTDAGSALVVNATDLTFSARTIKVKRGVIVPTRPSNLTAKRTSTHKAKLSFTGAKARGSKITGYTARCVARTGTHVVVDNESSGSPQYLEGLRTRVAYDCKIRAKSKAGPGHYTATVKVPRAP
jgi:hypothetical protein